MSQRGLLNSPMLQRQADLSKALGLITKMMPMFESQPDTIINRMPTQFAKLKDLGVSPCQLQVVISDQSADDLVQIWVEIAVECERENNLLRAEIGSVGDRHLKGSVTRMRHSYDHFCQLVQSAVAALRADGNRLREVIDGQKKDIARHVRAIKAMTERNAAEMAAAQAEVLRARSEADDAKVEASRLRVSLEQAQAAATPSFIKRVQGLRALVKDKNDHIAAKRNIISDLQAKLQAKAATAPGWAGANKARSERADAFALKVNEVVGQLLAEYGPQSNAALATRLSGILETPRRACWTRNTVWRARKRAAMIQARDAAASFTAASRLRSGLAPSSTISTVVKPGRWGGICRRCGCCLKAVCEVMGRAVACDWDGRGGGASGGSRPG